MDPLDETIAKLRALRGDWNEDSALEILRERNEECKEVEGTWPNDCIQRAFVEGAAWWQYHSNGSTMFGCERDEAEKEAVRRYGQPKVDDEKK